MTSDVMILNEFHPPPHLSLSDLFESHVCLKILSVVYMYAHERNSRNSRNYETALINCLIVFIIFVCGTFVFICVCSIARTGC